MNRNCDKCGKEAVEGELFHVFVDPNSDWWLDLFTAPQYCDKCVEQRRNKITQEVKHE